MESKDIFLLDEIIEYCDRIANTISIHGGDYTTFENDLDFQEVCAFRAIQIGELVNRLSDTIKTANPDVPWHLAVGLRNLLAHDYGHIDNRRMWNTLNEDFPTFRKLCVSIAAKKNTS